MSQSLISHSTLSEGLMKTLIIKTIKHTTIWVHVYDSLLRRRRQYIYYTIYICTHLEERLILETKSMCPLMAVVEGTQEASKVPSSSALGAQKRNILPQQVKHTHTITYTTICIQVHCCSIPSGKTWQGYQLLPLWYLWFALWTRSATCLLIGYSIHQLQGQLVTYFY